MDYPKIKQLVLPGNNPLTAQIDIGGIWHISIFVVLAIVVLKTIWKQTILELEEKLLLAYVLISSLFIIEYPALPFGLYNTAFKGTAAEVFLEALFIPLGAFLFFDQAKKLLPWIVGIELIGVWFGWGLLVDGPSFAAAFCACAIPFLPPWFWPIVLITILTHHASTALLIVAAQAFVVVLKARNKKWLLGYLGLLFLFLGIAYFHKQGAFLYGNGRVEKYADVMHFWTRRSSWIAFGVGPGSFMWVDLMRNGFAFYDPWLQLHSDWLQILWELGETGLALTIVVFARAARNVWNEPRKLSALFGLAAFGLPYHPTRFALTAFLAAMILISCRRTSNQSRPRLESSPTFRYFSRKYERHIRSRADRRLRQARQRPTVTAESPSG